MDFPELLELSRSLCQQRQPHVWVTVVSVRSPSSAYLGAQAIVEANGQMHGWIGGGCVQGAAREAALSSLATATPRRLQLSNSADPSEAVDVRPMTCASGGEVELFIQPAAVAPRLRIYGATPVARSVAWFARQAGFDPLTDVEAADLEAVSSSLGEDGKAQRLTTLERESYAVIATQGDGDEAALEKALSSGTRAMLVIASRKKAARLLQAMRLRGFEEDRLGAVRAPAGPDIGAITPNEIALAAVAGLIALRRGHVELCGANAENPKAETSPSGAGTADATGYVNPVCGAVIDPRRALSSVTVRDQTHYFCCLGCRTEFDRDPDKYLAIAAHMREPQRTSSP